MYELSQLAVCLLFVLSTIKDVHIYNKPHVTPTRTKREKLEEVKDEVTR